MPKGPNGEKRPADVIGAAIRVARIATGEEPETQTVPLPAGPAKGGKARAANLTPEERVVIARKGAAARWKKD